jgi:hypothetical protein
MWGVIDGSCSFSFLFIGIDGFQPFTVLMVYDSFVSIYHILDISSYELTFFYIYIYIYIMLKEKVYPKYNDLTIHCHPRHQFL